MLAFKRELRRELLQPIIPLDDDDILQFRALLQEVKAPIQEHRVQPLLREFIDLLEKIQGDIDDELEQNDSDYRYIASIEQEWDRIDRLLNKVEDLYGSLVTTTPPVTPS
jgi:Mg2+/Co2+ transporter CorC